MSSSTKSQYVPSIEKSFSVCSSNNNGTFGSETNEYCLFRALSGSCLQPSGSSVCPANTCFDPHQSACMLKTPMEVDPPTTCPQGLTMLGDHCGVKMGTGPEPTKGVTTDSTKTKGDSK